MIDLAIMTAAEATEQLRRMGMRISPEALRDGIDQGQFPFGNLIRKKGVNPVCFVYRKKLMEWAEECGYEVEESSHEEPA